MAQINNTKNMKAKLIWLCVAVAIALSTALSVAVSAYRRASREAERLSQNQTVLLSDIDRYKVADSLSAVQVMALRLSLSEYMSLYSDECETVRQLQSDVKGLQGVVNTQTQTIRDLKAQLKPVVVIHDTVMAIVDTLQCFSYSDKWIDVNGCIEDSTVSLNVVSRDEILAVESLERKRFLGIPLSIKCFGYRSRHLDAVSLNPNTTIVNVTYKTIEQ